MKNIQIILIVICLIPFTLFAQTINTIEYWYNNDFTSRVSVSLTPNTTVVFSELLSADALPAGVHSFNYRAKDSEGRWSMPQSQQFYKKPAVSGGVATVTGIEYWLDTDFGKRSFLAVSSPQQIVSLLDNIDMGAVPEGIHTLNYRAKDSEGRWSMPQRDMFYRGSVSAAVPAKIVAYRYWVDAASALTQVSVKDEPNPYHCTDTLTIAHRAPCGTASPIYIQFQDAAGRWGFPVINTFVNKYLATSNYARAICEKESYTDHLFSNLTIAGAYYDTLQTAYGCDSIVELTLTVNPLPAKPTLTQNGNNLTSSSFTGNQWYFNGTAISGATGQTHTCSQSGNYFVEVTGEHGCTEKSDNLNVTVSGIWETAAGETTITIYPNPVKDEIIIDNGEFLATPSGKAERKIENVEILDMYGRKIVNYQLSIINSINVSNLPSGVYILKIGEYRGRFVKE